jgi:dihydropteroate synthase
MLKVQDLIALVEKHPQAVQARVQEFSLDDHFFPFNSRPVIMGVINLSPDSWYRESVCLSADKAIQRGKILHAQGAEIIDVGAESTLAHAARVAGDAQKSTLLPVIKALRRARILVSIETYEPGVARACLESGANVLNLTGQNANDEIFRMAAAHRAAVILCYVQGRTVREVGNFDFSEEPMETMREHFSRRIEAATSAGVERIILDPGLGFYYSNLQDSTVRVRYQMNIFLNTFRLRTLGFPICQALPHAFETFGPEVRSAEPFFAVLAALGKTDLFRTHEVPRVKAVLDTLEQF